MKKIKVLFVAPFPPPYGGIARYASDLWNSKELNEEFEFHKLDTARGEKYLHGEGRSERTWQRGFYFLKPRNWLFFIFLLLNYCEYLYKLLTIRPDIVHVHTCSYYGFIRNGVFLFLAKLISCRRILHLHNAIDKFYEENRENHFFKSLIVWSLNQATEYVVLSEGLRSWLEDKLGKKAIVIWNACDSSNYLSIENDKAIFLKNFPQANGKTTILLLGGLYQHKGAFDLIKAVSEFSLDERENLLFILPGKGEYEKADALIKNLHLEDYVIIPGVIPEDIKDNLVRNSDIFTLPSYAEGQPIAILEAMSASLPIIASRVGSISEIVHDGINGILINPGDRKHLKNSILTLARDPEMRAALGKASRQFIEERHDTKCLVESIKKLYSNRSQS